LKLGLDGLFSDFPDTAVAVRNRVAGNPNQAVPEPSSLAILGILPLAEILRRRHQGGKKAKKAIASS
jgi:hypothetical protein